MILLSKTGFPGQPSNPVGFAASPNYPGSLTPATVDDLASGSPGAINVYSFLDFDPGGTNSTDLRDFTYIQFIGCRFQSNATGDANAGSCVIVQENTTFTYCSFTPRTAFYTSPPGAAWPSAGAWPATPTTSFVTGLNCIDGSSGHQYGCNVSTSNNGPVTWEFCDFWGFGQNGPGFFTSTAPMIVDNCWMHDVANAAPEGYHTDGLGYQNGGVGPSNVTITNCTVASIGNSNGIAWQFATGGYNNIYMANNYLSGYGYHTVLSTSDNMTNTTFINNTFGTDIPWLFGPIYHDYTTQFSGNGNIWRGNKLQVLTGTSPYLDSVFSFTSADNGKFIWPDSSLNTTDFV